VSWRLLTLTLVLVPGLFAWWSGRRLIGLLGDPAFTERLLARQRRLWLLIVACPAAPIFAGAASWWMVAPAAIVGSLIGDLPSRRVLFEEHWSLPAYLSWWSRFTLAWLGFWLLLVASPALLFETSAALRWPVAVALAAVLIAWNHCYLHVFLWLVRATPIAIRPSWESVLQAATIPRPRLLQLPVPGGCFVNAFAFPSTRRSVVLFSESLLGSFDEQEQAAVLGHEIAHLESFDRAKVWRMALALDGVVLAATVGSAVVLSGFTDVVPFLVIALLWTGTLLGAVAWSYAAQKRHEAKSDLRAVTLCGDGDAVVRALIKLTVLNALPRRWGLDFERASSHPSLARRVQLIRRAAGIVAPALAEPVEVAAARPGSFVVFDADRVMWLDGVPADCPRTPGTIRERAERIRAVPYSELVDLRVVAGLYGPAKLVATNRTGDSWALRVPSIMIPTLQAVLDRVDGLLTHTPVTGPPPAAVGRIVAVTLIGAATFGQGIGAAILAGVIGVARPSRTALAGVAAVGLACVVLYLEALNYLGALNRTQATDRQMIALAAAGLVMAVATWLATRSRPSFERPVDLLLPIGAYATATLLAWTPLVWELAREAGALSLGVAVHRTPVTWITPLALAAALLTVPRRAVQWFGGVLAVAVITLVLALSFSDRASAIAAREATPGTALADAPVLARIELPTDSTGLRLSPSGRRFAVALPGRGSGKRFLTGTPGGESIEISAVDLELVDDDHALVIAPAADAHVLRQVDLRSPRNARWEVVIADPPDPYIQYLDGAAWVLGSTDVSESFVGVFGRLGDAAVELRRWRPDLLAEGRAFRVNVLSREHALQVVAAPTALSRAPWGPLFYWMSGHSVESRMWLLQGDTARHLTTWPGGMRCLVPTHVAEMAVCVGWHTRDGGVVLWQLRPGRAPLGLPIAVPGDVSRWGVSHDGELLALYARDTVALVDLTRKHLIRRRVKADDSVALTALPRPGRLAMLWAAGNQRLLAVYDTR
jgi:Zn-dependent protease with chaperone function